MATESTAERRELELVREDETIDKFVVELPTSDQIRKADWQYSKVYNKALVEGLTTESEMLAILKDRGILGPQYDKQREDFLPDLSVKIKLLETAETDEEKAKAALEVRQARMDLVDHNKKITGPMSNTCEQVAEDVKAEYLTSCMVKKEDGTPVWDNYEEFLEDSDKELVFRARYEVLLWLQGLNQGYEDEMPENQAIKELMDSSRNKTDEQKQLADAEVEEAKAQASVEETPAPPAPKRKRRAPKKAQ